MPNPNLFGLPPRKSYISGLPREIFMVLSGCGVGTDHHTQQDVRNEGDYSLKALTRKAAI